MSPKAESLKQNLETESSKQPPLAASPAQRARVEAGGAAAWDSDSPSFEDGEGPVETPNGVYFPARPSARRPDAPPDPEPEPDAEARERFVAYIVARPGWEDMEATARRWADGLDAESLDMAVQAVEDRGITTEGGMTRFLNNRRSLLEREAGLSGVPY